MAAKVPDWPEAQSPFLSELLAAFKRRSKAIKYALGEWRIKRVQDGDFERLDFDFSTLGSPSQRLHLRVWEHEDIWLHSCQMGEGRHATWRYAFSFYLDTRGHSASEIVDTYQSSSTWWQDEEALTDHWREFSPSKDGSI